MYNRDKIEGLLLDTEPKIIKELQFPLILRLIKKLEEKQIEDDTLELMFRHLTGLAPKSCSWTKKRFERIQKKEL